MGVSDLALVNNDVFSQSLPKTRIGKSSSFDSEELARASFFFSKNWGRVYPLITSPSGSYEYDGDLPSTIEELIYFIAERASVTINREVFSEKKNRNILVLNELKFSQSKEDEEYVSPIAIDNALRILFNLKEQPEVFKTGESSIQLQFESSDRSYLEFEVFEKRITCMFVPKRDYDKVEYPEVTLDDLQSINEIVERYIGVAGGC